MTGPDRLLAVNSENQSPPGQPRLWRRLQSLVFILFCLEMGIVLVLFPWSHLWDRNYFFALAPQWTEIFLSSYLRGAISGVGVINVWIALVEAWRLRSS
ncbi:MAG: hypothetical protein HY236_07085 [Acidobacteria bacterium]|nr:hypothetical protein [Acidobacteriota bacterium]